MCKESILISACLLGEACRYDGKSQKSEAALSLSDKYNLIPFCPECGGGLPTPRQPAEISGGRVLSKNGEDVTAFFKKGAEKALEIALENNCNLAVLKERSPSCGSGRIYDGSFRNCLTDGDGITAALLKKHGIKVLGESEICTLPER